MNASDFINYYKKRDLLPDEKASEFDTLAALMKNQYGEESESIVIKEDIEAVDEILSRYRHFIYAIKDLDTRIEIADALDSLCQEKNWIINSMANIMESEMLEKELESAAENLLLPGSTNTLSEIIESFVYRYGKKTNTFAAGTKEHHRTFLADHIRYRIGEFQKKIRCTLCAKLRYCSGKDNKYPQLIWSSSRQVRYFLDIIQENDSSRVFTFILYSDEPLGTGKLVVRNRKKIMKTFTFRNEKRRFHNFTYNGNMEKTDELYFIIKEM